MTGRHLEKSQNTQKLNNKVLNNLSQKKKILLFLSKEINKWFELNENLKSNVMKTCGMSLK